MRRREGDKIFLAISAVLVCFGLFALASASLGMAAKEGFGLSHYLSRQVVLGLGVGGMLFWLGLRVNYRFWRKISLLLFLATLVLTAMVFLPSIGFTHGGARRWLDFGYFFLQPAELLKFGFLVYLSSWMASRREDIVSYKLGFIPFLVITGSVGALLIMQPDVGTFGVIALTAAVLFYLGGGRVSQLALLAICGFVLLSALIYVEPYRFERFKVFLNPEYDLQDSGYQLHQALISIGSGGIFGAGFGKSVQKFEYLPEPVGDSIFAVIAEEFGLLGAVLVIILFLLFLWRGLTIARAVPDNFGRLLASGIVILIVIQAFVNIGAMIGLLPLTGIPLVFISQGGSSLAAALLMVGVVLNISKYREV